MLLSPLSISSRSYPSRTKQSFFSTCTLPIFPTAGLEFGIGWGTNSLDNGRSLIIGVPKIEKTLRSQLEDFLGLTRGVEGIAKSLIIGLLTCLSLSSSSGP